MLQRPLRIGNVAIDFPAGLGALAGYSDWPFRVLCRRFGAGFAVAEVLLDRFVISVTKGSKAGRFIRVDDEDHPCGAQLMGDDPEVFAQAAKTLATRGFDWIDLNFACPVRKVLGKCRGGWFLGHPAEALRIVAIVRDAIPPEMPLTLKLRRGLDHTQASEEHFHRIVEGAWDLGVSAITVHPRTVLQRYQGSADWTFLARLRRRGHDRVILGSGDLHTPASACRMAGETGVDGLWIARGAVGYPWFFSELQTVLNGQPLPPPPSVFEQRRVLEEHFSLAVAAYGPDRAVSVMRNFLFQYAKIHPCGDALRQALVSMKTRSDWDQLLRSWYREDLPGLRKPLPAPQGTSCAIEEEKVADLSV
ncbi:tRNA dihydrouridine synthase [Thermopirellula anaerolimosa]